MIPPNQFFKILSEKKVIDYVTEDFNKEKEFNKKCLWYHGNVNRKKAEAILRSKECKPGWFLVRESHSSRGDVVVSVRCDETKHAAAVEHYKIIRNQNDAIYHMEKFKEQEFHGLENLIAYYHEEQHGLAARLDKFVPCQPPSPECRCTGRTNVLHNAIQGRVVENIQRILDQKKCPDINSKDCEGSSVLHLACEQGMVDVVEALIKHPGPKLNTWSKNKTGYSALHVACQRNQPAIVRLLLEKGKSSPVDICLHNRWTALHVAADAGHLECVKCLLEFGAPDRPRDKESRIPYELAQIKQWTAVVNYLDTYVRPPPPLVIRKDWFHEKQSRQSTVELFDRLGPTNGLFLIRRSSHGTNYALSLWHGQLFHYEIKVIESNVFFIDDGPLMTSLEHIVYHYSRFVDGLACRLKTAIAPDETLKAMEVVMPELRRVSSEITGNGAPEKGEPGDSTYDEVYSVTPNASAVKITSAGSLRKQANDPLAHMLIYSKNIELSHELGQGEFGSVMKGIYTKHELGILRKKVIKVAVKTLLDQPLMNNKEAFLMEARVMCDLDHPNIVKLIGICEGPPLMIVQELVKMGSMLDYLWDYASDVKIDTDLILWAAQIAYGMMYLETRKMVHRDLAARNILLASKTLAKISDFGLSRALNAESDYYKASKGGRWPVKWYAPESINYGTFSHASDVWSYGITLYEMFTFGDQPYGEKSGSEVIQMLERGYRLEKPEKCPQPVYDIMRQCWETDPANRLTFEQIFNAWSTDPAYSHIKSMICQKKSTKMQKT